MNEIKETKTQKNNRKKLEKLQEKEYDAGRPIPQQLPATQRAIQQENKKRKLRARVNLSRFRTPDEVEVKLGALPPELKKLAEEGIALANRKARNRRRNARRPITVAPKPSNAFQTVRGVKRLWEQRRLKKEVN